MGIWSKAEQKHFDRLGYPVPPSIDLRLNKEEADYILSKLGTCKLAVKKELEKEIKQYDEMSKTRYQRPWCRADDY